MMGAPLRALARSREAQDALIDLVMEAYDDLGYSEEVEKKQVKKQVF
jgi:hypothetical protein